MKTRKHFFLLTAFFYLTLGWQKVSGAPLPLPTQNASPSSLLDHHTHPRLANRVQRKTPWVALNVNVIYAHIRDSAFLDPKLKSDLPILQGMYDFNAYKLLKRYRYKVPYRQAIIIPISYHYQVHISPLRYDKKQKRLVLQATFLHRKKQKHQLQSFFTRYASTQISLINHGRIAFLGPIIRSGRSLLTLRVHRIYK